MRWLLGMIAGMLWMAPARAEPVALDTAFEGPDRLSISGSIRARYETLQGQFRAGGQGGDQAVFFRSLVLAEADLGGVRVGIELQDSRAYLDDAGTPLSSSFVNALDFLQIYGEIDVASPFAEPERAVLTLGRQTIHIGSGRQIERPNFANVVKSYTGAYYETRNRRGEELHLFAVSPIDRLPRDRDSIADNQIELDEEAFNRLIWAVHYRRPDILPGLADGVWGELFVYGLDERDEPDRPTVNRSYIWPGLRLYRVPRPGAVDLDVEAAARFGSRRASAHPDDRRDLDVAAGMVFAALGYSFDAPWEPRLALEYYWASGDDDPDDDDFDRFERLFGSRRGDLNNTSLHGPLTPANLNAPGFRIEARPGPRTDFRVHYSAAYLASERDAWIIADLRDPTGGSGSFIGHTLDGRIRHRPYGEGLALEFGGSWLEFGGFARSVPGGPEADRTLYGYLSATVTF